MNIDDLPDDVVVYELLPKLELRDLFNLSLTSKKYGKSVKDELEKRLQQGVLSNYNIHELYDMGKSLNIKYYVIQEILNRLNSNVLKDLIKAFPDKSWDYLALSTNPNIDYKYVLENSNKPWNYFNLSANPSITYQDVLNDINKPWFYASLSSNPSITYNDVLNGPIQLKWYGALSKNPAITFKDVLQYPNAPWVYDELSLNPNITYQDIKRNPKKSWDINNLALNPNITFQDVLRHPGRPWMYYYLSQNSNITYQDVLKQPNKKNIFGPRTWDYDALSRNPSITYRDVSADHNQPWNYSQLSKNPSITMEDVVRHPKKSWNYISLNSNPGISIDVAKFSPSLQAFESISNNPAITYQDVAKNIDKPWNFTNLSKNKFTKDPHYIGIATKYIRNLLGNDIKLKVNDDEYSLTPSGAYGFLLGLILSNQLQNNNITLENIKINKDDAKFLFFNNDARQRYYIKIDGKVYWFNDLSFLTNLELSGITPDDDEVFDREIYKFITPQYSE